MRHGGPPTDPDTPRAPSAALGLDAAVARACDALEAPRSGAWLRFVQPVEAVEPLAWLRAQPASSRVYWHDRDDDFELAGLGCGGRWDANDLEALGDVLADLPRDDARFGVRVLATARFDLASTPTPGWEDFGRASLLLPLIELRRSAGECALVVNALGDTENVERARTLLAELRAPRRERCAFRATMVEDAPDHDGWNRAVETVLAKIASDGLEKCVLTRRRRYAVEGTLDPFGLLAALAAGQQDTFRFGVETAAGTAFVGATPELLLRHRGTEVESEALAGSRARGADEESDGALASALLQSDKDRREHAFVRAHVERCLGGFCDEPVASAGPELRRWPTVQHLRTRLRGRLRRGVSAGSLLAVLHPTPAVLGAPEAAAWSAVRELEPFDRGLYCGLVGCVGPDEASVAVGIRCARVEANRVELFAGAGIVAGSSPDAEWDETVDKMRPLAAILESGRAG